MNYHRVKPTMIALALVAAFPVSSALAQSAEPAATEAKKTGATQLEAVIVTASRRSENIKEVPQSVSTINTESLDTLNASGQDVRALSGRVPSLNIESDFGRTFPRFYIRGIGNIDFDMNASQPVGLVYDDIVQENIALKGFPVFDVEQVEMLRGPQGTLFGRNSPAGVLKFDSVKPSKRFEGYANIGFGRWNAVNVETAVNVPVSADWQVRMAGLLQRQSDRVHNTIPGATSDFEGYNDKAVRLQAAYKNGGFYGLFKVQGRDYTGTATSFRANILKQGTNDLVDGFDYRSMQSDGLNTQTLTSSEVSARLRWELDGLTLHSITGYDRAKFYSRADVDGGYGAAFLPNSTIGGRTNPAVMGPNYPGQDAFIPFDAQTADGIPYLRQVTQEFRLQSNTTSRTQWIAGIYMFNEKLQVDSFNYDSFGPGDLQNGYAVQHQEAKSWAAFGNVNYAVTPDFKVRGGLRYTDDKKDFDASRTQHPWLPNLATVTTNPKTTNWSWDLGANYNVDKATSLFARVATGYRSPSIQGRVLFANVVSVAKEEKVLSIEGGFKSDLLNNTARLSGTVFKYRIKDMQMTASSGAVNQNILLNVAKAEGQGFELDAQAILGRDWKTTLGFSYNDTEIRDPNLFTQTCGAPCTLLDPLRPGSNPADKIVSLNGNPLPRAPKVVWNWTMKYSTELGNGELYALTDWAYKDKYNMYPYEATEFTAKSVLEGGLRIGYGWANGKYEVAGYVRNMTNRQVAVSAITFNNLTGIVNEPRSFGMQFKANF